MHVCVILLLLLVSPLDIASSLRRNGHDGDGMGMAWVLGMSYVVRELFVVRRFITKFTLSTCLGRISASVTLNFRAALNKNRI